MSDVARKGHKNHPRDREFYVNMGKKSGEARRNNKQENEQLKKTNT